MYAHDVGGSRDNSAETALTKAVVQKGLRVTWRFKTPAPVYGTPAVVGGRVYAADTAGDVYALAASTGSVAWISHAGAAAFPYMVTASPLVTDTSVIIGDQNGTVWALDRATGIVRWAQRPNNYGYPSIYGSPVLASVRTPTGRRTLILVPIASNEETFTPTKVQPCCSSRGSVAALDPASGAVVWQTYTISDRDAARGAAGAGVWSTPTYDAVDNRVYISTGNNYANRATTPSSAGAEAILAVDAATGHPVWDNRRTPDDTWTYAYRGFADGHVDADFGDSPKLIRQTNGRLAVAAGQKSGFLHVLDAVTGRTVAVRQFLPGGGLGGFFADSATAGGVIFAPGNDWTDFGGGELGALVSSPPKAGSVVAVRVDRPGALAEVWRFSTPGSPMMGGVAVAGGVVYIQAAREGRLYALDASTGRRLSAVDIGPGINGPAVAEGGVFVGVGDITGAASYDPTSGAVVAIGPVR
jgi:polyvinyl alcohol dehydrogenase (cytochrome)